MGVHGGYVHTESGEAHGGVSGRHSQWTTTISSSTRSLMQPAIPAGAVACLSILRTARKWYPRDSVFMASKKKARTWNDARSAVLGEPERSNNALHMSAYGMALLSLVASARCFTHS